MGQEPYAHPVMDEVTLSAVLHALSDPLRLAIVATLARDGARAWGEFSAGVAPSTLSHHMRVLRLAGIVSHRRDGTRCQVSLRPELDLRFPGLLASVLAVSEPPR